LSRKRRSFSQGIQTEAVAPGAEHGYSHAEADRNFGIDVRLIARCRWDLEAAEGEAFPGKGNAAPDTATYPGPGKPGQAPADGEGHFKKPRPSLPEKTLRSVLSH
jgi:hypothetical protein